MTERVDRGGAAADRRAMRRPPRRGYGLVLLLIVATYGLALRADQSWIVAVLLFVQTGTVWQALRVARARPALRLAAAAVFALAMIASMVDLLQHASPLVGLTFLAASGLYLLAPPSIVRDLAQHQGVDEQTMFGALAAYLLIGMAFGFAYACIGELQPGPLFGDAGDGTLSQTLFFSFVTMTTTGYGNLVPATNPAQSLAVLEALVGQLFLVTAVAKLVEHWRPRGWRQATDGSAETAGAGEPDEPGRAR